MPAVDYAALAAQARQKAPAPAVDYNALATQARTAHVVPPQPEPPLVSPGVLGIPAGRGTRLDVSKSQDYARGVGAAVPFAGVEQPESLPGYAGRASGEAALLAVPVGKAVGAVAKALPNAARAGVKFQRVMGAAGDVPLNLARPGDSALRIMQLAERGGTMPKVVRDLLRRATDPNKGPLLFREGRDFYHNISRLSADEFKRLTPVVKREIVKLRLALNDSLTQAASTVGEGGTYSGAMKEYANAARLHEFADMMKKWALPAGAGGAAALYGKRKVSELLETIGGS